MLPARISTVSIDVGLEHRKGAISTGSTKFIDVLAQFMVLDFIIYYTSAHLIAMYSIMNGIAPNKTV